MVITEKVMDLFTLDKKYILCHCISLDCQMGKGIARRFNDKFPSMQLYIKRVIKENNLNYPVTIVDEYDDWVIFNLITKNRYFEKATYDSLDSVLEDISAYCKENNLKYLAMPRIGCDLDKLNWSKVKAMIEKWFSDLDIEIIVCMLEK